MNSSKTISSNKKQSRMEQDDEFSAAIAFAHAAQAKAAKARAEAADAGAEAERAIDEAIRKGEELKARIRAEEADADACAPDRSRTRELLVKALGMLGSDQVGERAAAALMAERQRTKLGMTWDQLIAGERDDEDEDLDDEDLDEDDENVDDDSEET